MLVLLMNRAVTGRKLEHPLDPEKLLGSAGGGGGGGRYEVGDMEFQF